MKLEKVKEYANQKGLYPLFFDKDIDTKTKHDYADNEGYRYSLTFDEIKDKRSNHYIVRPENPYTIYNIQKYIANHGSNTKLLSTTWEDSHKKLQLKCGECGREYEARWYHIYKNHKFQCNKCGYKNPYNRKSIEDAKKICAKHGLTIIEETYKKRKQFDLIDKLGYRYSNCTIHKLSFHQVQRRRFSYDNTYCKENLDLFAKLKIDLITKDMTEEMKARVIREITGLYGSSSYEAKVEDYLYSHKVKYKSQKTFSWCKIKNKCRFDFYLIDYNIVLEVHGNQHYIDCWLNNFNVSHQQEIDKFKKDSCEQNGVKYIEIPFWTVLDNTFIEIIDNIITNVTT